MENETIVNITIVACSYLQCVRCVCYTLGLGHESHGHRMLFRLGSLH